MLTRKQTAGATLASIRETAIEVQKMRVFYTRTRLGVGPNRPTLILAEQIDRLRVWRRSIEKLLARVDDRIASLELVRRAEERRDG